MTRVFAATALLMAAAWLPLALRFLRGFRNRRNPVSLAICAALCLFTYANVIFALVLLDQTTVEFLAKAVFGFEIVILVNFYVAFKWSEKRFPEQRHPTPPADYTVPPTNTTNTPR